MKKFFSVFLFLLLAAVPGVQAQKWKAFQGALVPARTKIMLYAFQRKAESAVLRAAAARQLPGRVVPGQPVIKISSLSNFAPTKTEINAAFPKAHFPLFPFQENDREMYRGMALDAEGKSLRHILQNGLEVSKSHYENFAAYDGQEYPEDAAAIYAAHSPKHAQYYILSDLNSEQYLPVILHIKKVGWRMTVSVPHDIPPSWIYRVSALLKVGGQLQWGEIKWQNKGFVFLPYPVPPSKK